MAHTDMAMLQDEEMAPVSRQALKKETKQPTVDKSTAENTIEQKVIKDGRLGLKVTSLEKSKSQVDSLLSKFDGFYANENFNNSDFASSYDLNIRIPNQYFELFIAKLEKGTGEVTYKVINARDVTDQFIDLETRLENKRSYLQRYRELLKQAKSIKEILEIEEKIRGLEEEIESTTGRLKYLSNQVDFSTLRLNLTKEKDYKYSPKKRHKFSERIKQSISKGWFAFIDFTLFMIKLWPFWILFAMVFYFWRKRKKRKK